MTAAATKVGEEMAQSPHREPHAMTFSTELDIRVTDSCLRDGSHAKRHQFTDDDVRAVVAALDAAGHARHRGHPRRRARRVVVQLRLLSSTDERVLMKAAVETATRPRSRR